MDFKKIERIFLIVFLGVNIFLFQIYREGDAGRKSAATTLQTESIEKRLEYAEIKYQTLSTKTEKGYYLSGEEHSWTVSANFGKVENNGTLLTVNNGQSSVEGGTPPATTESIEAVDEEELAKNLAAYMQENPKVAYGEEYTYASDFSTLVESENQVMALQSYEGLMIYGSTSQILFNLEEINGEKQIVGYRQTYSENLEPLREQQELISEKDAIKTLYNNNRIPDKAEIRWTHLAYSRTLKVRGKSVYVPVWFVLVATSKDSVQLEKVNAMTNVAISSSAVVEVIN